LKDKEAKLYHETHERDVLQVEKQKLTEQINALRAANQNMGRKITKEKYHNNLDEIEKDRRKVTEEVQADIIKLSDEAEKEQNEFEKETERNSDPNRLEKS